MKSFSELLYHLESLDWVLEGIVVPLGTFLVRIFVQFPLETFWPLYQRHVHLPGRFGGCLGGLEAQDGAVPPAKDCIVTFKEYRYGPEKRQTIDVIRPVDTSLTDATPLLYIHGGGFVAANSAVMLHSVTAFARAPYYLPVYSIDYPLSPEHPYPCPLISVMAALRYMKEQLGFHSVCILGDSAGASLALMATLWATEGFDMPELSCGCSYPPLHPSQLPTILGVASAYGVLDSHSWHHDHCGRLKSISPTEQAVAEFGLEASIRMYTKNQHIKQGQPTQFLDVLKQMPPRAAWSLPPINLQCGGKDILVNSTKATNGYLRKRGARVTMQVYPQSRHAFVGLPPAWVCNKDSRHATREIADFFYDLCHAPSEPKSPSSTISRSAGSTTAADSSSS
ncbi:hypothetical protein FOZ63_004093 [Perkinsus olseni]|uniref:Alpha/beta hydrolase fold-3 domain-containing protein n=1 Tax=Perkinsus olseni TaxID=32597 RepID=A0A7J6RD25_PEROL|nr:hypothetical protein FOZ63_004093 [Perkinsus olseni]